MSNFRFSSSFEKHYIIEKERERERVAYIVYARKRLEFFTGYEIVAQVIDDVRY